MPGGMMKSNGNLVDLIEKVKPEIRTLIEKCNTVSIAFHQTPLSCISHLSPSCFSTWGTSTSGRGYDFCTSWLNCMLPRCVLLLSQQFSFLLQVKMWVQLLIPRIEDGNNFGVSIQEETVAELRTVEGEAASYLDQISRFLQVLNILHRIHNESCHQESLSWCSFSAVFGVVLVYLL